MVVGGLVVGGLVVGVGWWTGCWWSGCCWCWLLISAAQYQHHTARTRNRRACGVLHQSLCALPLPPFHWKTQRLHLAAVYTHVPNWGHWKLGRVVQRHCVLPVIYWSFKKLDGGKRIFRSDILPEEYSRGTQVLKYPRSIVYILIYLQSDRGTRRDFF